MAIQVEYRHSRFTAVPEDLSAPEIWAAARKIRNQLVEDRFERRLSYQSRNFGFRPAVLRGKDQREFSVESCA